MHYQGFCGMGWELHTCSVKKKKKKKEGTFWKVLFFLYDMCFFTLSSIKRKLKKTKNKVNILVWANKCDWLWSIGLPPRRQAAVWPLCVRLRRVTHEAEEEEQKKKKKKRPTRPAAAARWLAAAAAAAAQFFPSMIDRVSRGLHGHVRTAARLLSSQREEQHGEWRKSPESSTLTHQNKSAMYRIIEDVIYCFYSHDAGQ